MSRKIQHGDANSTPARGKTLAIMQPYFLPYIGYWQLMQAVDEFIIYDDVQFSKGGWINRNRLLLDGAAHTFTLPLRKGRLREKINERELSEAFAGANQSLLAKVTQAYSNAPCFSQVMPVLEQIMAAGDGNLANFLCRSLEHIKTYLGITTPLLRSSALEAGRGLRASDRVLALCKAREAGTYINAPGGRDLYDKAEFATHGIKLHFIQSSAVTYRQFGDEFVPSLSILDIMMFNTPAEVREMLNRYTLD